MPVGKRTRGPEPRRCLGTVKEAGVTYSTTGVEISF